MGDKVAISKAPNLNVIGLKAPTRSENSTYQVFKASWSYPKNAFSEKNKARFEGVLVEWTVDFDPSSSSASEGKKEQISGTKRSYKKVTAYAKSDKTEDTFSIPRGSYYPANSGKMYTLVRLYTVVKKGTKKLKKPTRNKKWNIKSVEISPMELSELNKRIKRTEITSLAALQKSNASPVGKTYYVSKISSTQTIEIAGKNPILYGIGVRVQGWNSKTPTRKKKYNKKKKEWKTPAEATKSNVLWNDAAPTQAAYFTFGIPKDPKANSPSISGSGNYPVEFTFADHDNNVNNGDTGSNAYERYDSVLKMYMAKGVYDNSGKFTSTKRSQIWNNVQSTADMSVSRNTNYDLGSKSFASFRPNEFIQYDVDIYNRGLRGDSANKKSLSAAKPSATFLIARPHDVSIKSVNERGELYEIAFTRSAGMEGKRKTDTYKLQRLYNFRPEKGSSSKEVDDWSDREWAEAAENQPDSAWTDVATLGHSNDRHWDTQTFTDRIVNAAPQPFRRTYYRVVASNSIPQMPPIVSSAVVIPGFLRIPSAKDEVVDILSCSSAENGNAIQAIVTFNKSTYLRLETAVGDALPEGETIYVLNSSGAYVTTSDTTASRGVNYYVKTDFYNSNGTEMTWDTFEYAWQSNQAPSLYDFKDEQMEGYICDVTAEAKAANAVLSSSKVHLGWKYTTYYIRGVQPYTKYFLKARRFLKDTETRETDSYGEYSDYTDEGGNPVAIETKSKPYEVKLYAPERLVEGRDFSVSWTYDLDGAQKGYQLLSYQNKPDAENKTQKGTALSLYQTGTKEDTAPYAVVPWANIEEALVGTEGSPEHLFTAVRVYTDDGQWSEESEIQETRIVRPPRATLSQIPTVDRQPVLLTFGTDDPQCSIVMRVVAHQLMGWGPQGADNVAEGSIVYSTKIVKPNWAFDDTAKWYYSNFEFPTGLPFKNGGSYTVEYTAVNDEDDVDSDVVAEDGTVVKQTTDFLVKYSDSVEVPNFYVVADPVDEDHGGAAHISVMDTPGKNEGCVADLYRVTPDGAYLVSEGVSDWRNATFIDPYPPYSRRSTCTYRLALRSQNGVTEWDDRSYAIAGYSIRFDWGNPESEEHGQYTHLTLPYNLKWSDSWTKNSRVELHLDGAYNGYWRGGVDHKNTLSTEFVKMTGEEQIARVRALANYAGPVLVRLPNGCAFAADVQVSNLDVSYDSLTISASFSAQEIRLPDQFGKNAVELASGLYVPQA